MSIGEGKRAEWRLYHFGTLVVICLCVLMARGHRSCMWYM